MFKTSYIAILKYMVLCELCQYQIALDRLDYKSDAIEFKSHRVMLNADLIIINVM